MQITFSELTNKFLKWSMAHQAARTTEWYEGYIKQCLVAIGDQSDKPASEMKPFHLEEWTDSHKDWGNTYKRGAIVAINRVYNWGVKSGHIDINSIKTAYKPPTDRRKTYMKPDDYTAILNEINPNDPFRDLLIFVWNVGCRPQEVRHIEPRHVNLEKGYILFPKEESKGKRSPRKILMNATALEIITRLMAINTDGKIFRNTRGKAWTKFALCNRMYRLSKDTRIKSCMYDIRHGFATRKLKAKHGHLQIAACLGHTDGSMLARVYSHIDEDDEHIREILVD